MKHSNAKVIDACILGDDVSVRQLEYLLNLQKKKTLTHTSPDAARLINKTLVSVDEQLYQSTRSVIFCSPTAADIALVGISPKTAISTQLTHKELVIYGHNEQAVMLASKVAKTVKSEVLTPHETLLPDYDRAVQEVIARMLTKLGCKITYKLTLKDSAKNEGGYTATSSTGRVIKTPLLVIEPALAIHYDDFGLSNADIHAIPSCSDNVLALQTARYRSTLELHELAKFLSGKKTKLRSLLTLPSFQEFQLEGHTVFSYGLKEQSIEHTHLRYRRSVVKLPSAGNMACFIKVLANAKGQILGASGITTVAVDSLSIMRRGVNELLHIDELLAATPATHPLSLAILAVKEEL